MKSWINKLYILSFLSLALFACEKEEDRAIFREGTQPTLTTSASSNIVLSKDSADQNAIKFSWTPTNFGYQGPVEYSLEFLHKDSTFETASKIHNLVVGAGLEKTLTVAELNDKAVQLKLAPDVASEMKVRVKAAAKSSQDVSGVTPAIYSTPVTISVTPYSSEVVYAKLWVPGSHQDPAGGTGDWKPEMALNLFNFEGDNYVGYVNFPDAENNFKFTSEAGWSGINYGDGGAGKLSTDGGAGNLVINGAGYYKVTANPKLLTWSATKESWGIIGSATAGGWDTDVDMIYDYATNTLKLEAALVAGEMKFRLNDAWSVNYGDDKPDDNELNAGGANITIGEAGTYIITLDLTKTVVGEPATYSITKK